VNDERINDYLRERGRVVVPLDLVESVADAVATTPQAREWWLNAWIPAFAAVGAAAVILVVSLVIGQTPDVGPQPAPSASPFTSATATPSESAAASPLETPVAFQSDADLLAPGNAMLLEIRSVEGVQGRITIERGEDAGGYLLMPEPSSETYFFVELFATYDLDVGLDLASWGSIDWSVEGIGLEGAIQALEVYPYPVNRRPIGTWPGATVPEEAYTGWMIFAVPREAAGENLELVYQPPGVPEQVRIPLRAAAAAPESVDPEWPRPDPVYVAQDGLPFTVLENAEADALFVEPDTCTNPEAGYTVSYPDSWYTNTAVGDVPACSWFSPVFYELNEDGSRPEEIAIEISVFHGAIGFIWVDLYTEDVVLDGFGARRYETGMTKEASMPTNQLMYAYVSYLGNESDGRKLWAFTGTEYGGSYSLNRAVFDRIMASLEFTD